MTTATDSRDDSTRRLRIIHCFRNPVGGLFRHVRDLCAAQIDAGHAVGIVCDSTTGGAFEEQLFGAIQPTLELGLRRISMRRQIALSDVIAARRVYAGVKPLRPDILHGHGAKGGAYARIAGTTLRVFGAAPARIYTPHGGSLHHDPRRLKSRAYFTAERALERITDAFLFVSRYEAMAYSSKVRPPRPVTAIVPNGLREDEFDRITLAPEARDFVFVGMLRDLKGPDLFIRALAKLRDKGNDRSAHIYGAGEDAERYRNLAKELGLGHALAFHDPIPAREALSQGHVLVVPSRAESMPYIVLEAAAAAVPMVATAVGGIPEIFDDKADRLVPPGNVEVLATAMTEARSNSSRIQRQADALRNTVRAAHTIGRMADSVERTYRMALVTPRR